jgi:hypothetical protein
MLMLATKRRMGRSEAIQKLMTKLDRQEAAARKRPADVLPQPPVEAILGRVRRVNWRIVAIIRANWCTFTVI